MLYKSQRSNASITAGFLNTDRNNGVSAVLHSTVGWFTSLLERMEARHRQAVLHRQTMTAMTKLNDRMLSDVGWPGRYEPEERNDTAER